MFGGECRTLGWGLAAGKQDGESAPGREHGEVIDVRATVQRSLAAATVAARPAGGRRSF